MKTPFSWKLTACACAVLLAACGSSSAPKDLPIGGGASASTSTTAGASTTNTADAATNNNTDSSATTDNTNSGNSTNDSATNTGTTNNSAATESETVIKYNDTPFGKNMTFDDGFQWGGVATQQPHLRDTKHVTSGGQLDKVVVDGQEIMLLKAAQTPRLNVMTGGGKTEETDADGNVKIKYNNAVFQSTRGGYSYTWFGIINKPREDIRLDDGTTEHIDTMIAHGKLTDEKEMPKTGSAQYNGHAIYYTNGTPNLPPLDASNRVLPTDPYKSIGTTQFNVDYAKQTISGSIKDDAQKAADIMLQGTISGNSFEGTKTQTYNGKNVDVEMKGRFFGPNAAELGGVFNSRNNDDILGAFGAKKAK